jgi:hypothetical protein
MKIVMAWYVCTLCLEFPSQSVAELFLWIEWLKEYQKLENKEEGEKCFLLYTMEHEWMKNENKMPQMMTCSGVIMEW